MTPRYELQAVRLNGEIYPAIVDLDSKDKRPFVFYAKDRPGYKELIKLMAEYRGAQIVGLQPRDILHLPHYLSDKTVDDLKERNAAPDIGVVLQSSLAKAVGDLKKNAVAK